LINYISVRTVVLLAVMIVATEFASAQAPTATVLYQFHGADNASPTSNLIQLPTGDIMGMTGGPANNAVDAGTIFLLKTNGTLQTLFQFAADGSQCASGMMNPSSLGGALMQASDGNIYGVCSAGGAFGNGSIFRFTTSGQFMLLHSFNGSDGSFPAGQLVQWTDGNLYGVTLGDHGGVFRVSLNGDFAPVYNFANSAAASSPSPGLAPGPDGNLYGMYQIAAPFGFGGTYRIDPTGGVTFPSFFLSTPFSQPPVMNRQGTIFALAQAALPGSSQGRFPTQTLQAISPANDHSVVVQKLPPFHAADFVNFAGGMTLASDDRFYVNGTSVIERPTTPYVELQLNVLTQHTNFFDLGPYGQMPVLNPLEGTDGKIYIANNGGGQYGLGNILALDYGLASPAPKIASVQPSSGAAGTTVAIHGAFFVNVKAVRLNGRSVPFQVVSSSLIRFVVPAGAKSGNIEITAAGGIWIDVNGFTVQ
jgi:uncharacterized repeat protein (TIGR03803 family)